MTLRLFVQVIVYGNCMNKVKGSNYSDVNKDGLLPDILIQILPEFLVEF